MKLFRRRVENDRLRCCSSDLDFAGNIAATLSVQFFAVAAECMAFESRAHFCGLSGSRDTCSGALGPRLFRNYLKRGQGRFQQNLRAQNGVFGLDEFRFIMAETIAARHEDHGSIGDPCEKKRIMEGAR
jgi:hypothetical protein